MLQTVSMSRLTRTSQARPGRTRQPIDVDVTRDVVGTMRNTSLAIDDEFGVAQDQS